jgi:hypothetical protein
MSLATFLGSALLPSSGRVALIALMTEAVQTSETLVNSYQSTRRYNPEVGHLHSDRRENQKAYCENIIETQRRVVHEVHLYSL